MARRLLAVLPLLLVAPALAHAQGFEYAAAGTRALGRGGAFSARADDPMALGYNPAALAFLPGYQLMANANLAFYDACVQRSGGYDSSGVSTTSLYDSRFGFPDPTDDSNWVRQAFPMVCRGGAPGPSPQLVFTMHPLPELGIGIGILAPSGVGSGHWGNDDGTVTANGITLPTPTRYALVSQDLLLFHPSIGVGWSPIRELSLGVTLQWGMAIVDFVNHTNAGTGAEDPAQDVRTHLHAEDLFVPAIIASVHVVPIDELDIVATARFSDGIDAGATLDLTTGFYGTDTTSFSPETTSLTGARRQAGQPWQFSLSARYADRRQPRFRDPDEAGRISGRIEDHLQNENWDVEVDLFYQLNSQVRDFVVTPPAGAEVAICEGPRVDGNCATRLQAPLPGALPIAHGWADQFSVRVGGDWNVIPGQLALRVGSHFATSGFNSRYQTQDQLPGMRLGLHAGVTLRIERFDISLAYAHIFQFDETISDANASFRMVSATGMQGQCADGGAYDPNQPVTSRGCYPQGFGSVVNAGRYTGELNVVSLQASYNFW